MNVRRGMKRSMPAYTSDDSEQDHLQCHSKSRRGSVRFAQRQISSEPVDDNLSMVTITPDSLANDETSSQQSVTSDQYELKDSAADSPKKPNIFQNIFGGGGCIRRLKWIAYGILFAAYNVYLAWAALVSFSKCPSWCDGVRFLIAVTSAAYIIVILNYFSKQIGYVLNKVLELFQIISECEHGPKVVWILCWIGIGLFIFFDGQGDELRLRSFAGSFCVLFLGFAVSNHRLSVDWYVVQKGLLLQYLMGLLVLRWKFGQQFIECIGNRVSQFLLFTESGSEFVFGYLVNGNIKIDDRDVKLESVFVFKVLPVVCFFSFVIEMLYYYGVIQRCVVKCGSFLSRILGTPAIESISAVGNVFLGMTEAPLLIKPYFPKMTRSEIHAVMAGGFATVSGSVVPAYISFGISPAHLLTASLMSAPAALTMAKLIYPEKEQRRCDELETFKSDSRSLLEAAAKSATDSVSVIGHITANLICFLASLSLLNALLRELAANVGVEDFDFEILLGYIFTPMAFILGVPMGDCKKVGELIGLRTVANELVAYRKLGGLKDSMSERARILSTYALCGFASISSIGILLGASNGLCPQRSSDFARVTLRAFFSGTLACLLTACVAGCLLR